ncbi:hypothetical protein DSO57_1005756 [Entomophthora muscae]|uniref:Uncharacterized protein n=1 Tax=Entomophthora muscae TaxID=34485 RepID=A0ACC2U6M5_9FUNG|nr:hypothetical protein DSO57_1005756 [Entomophthora muscae]
MVCTDHKALCYFRKPQKLLLCQACVMQALSSYKFKCKFVKGKLNILPGLMSCNPAMYLVRGDEDPQVTIIPESLILLESGSLLPQTPVKAPVAPPQILAIGPAPSSEAAPPLALSACSCMTF